MCSTGRTACESGLISCQADVSASLELCDGLDNDCDGTEDEGPMGADLTTSCYDGPDGTEDEGVCTGGIRTCVDGEFGMCAGQMLPGPEICDNMDNDCDGIVDEVDADMDGAYACPGPTRDCNDEDPNVYPGATEVCNLIDDNCNGLTDEFAEETYYRDVDMDGVGNTLSTVEACGAPEGYVSDPGDCNDNNPDIYPGAPELCNNIDDDCNAIPDDGVDLVDTYVDVDGDGYGAGVAQPRCLVDTDMDMVPDTSLDGRVPNADDCNDSGSEIFPGAPELCDTRDNDCDEVIDPWCGYSCAGSWPYDGLTGTTRPSVAVADMNQDGSYEIGVTNTRSASLLSAEGAEYNNWSSGSANFARNPGIFTDVDGVWTGSQFNLEWVLGMGSRLGFVRFDGTDATWVESPYDIYDAAQFLARDIDGNGLPEIVAPNWPGVVRIAEYDAMTDNFIERVNIPQPNGAPIYTNWFTLADVDFNDSIEVVFGAGYRSADAQTAWDGSFYAYGIDPMTWAATDLCPGCYDTTNGMLYPMGTANLLVYDADSDGTNTLFGDVLYSTTNDPVGNTVDDYYAFEFDATDGSTIAGPTVGNICLDRELSSDGALTCRSPNGWYHDVDGDGDQDRIVITGGQVHIDRWDAGAYARMPGAPFPVDGTVRYFGDLTGNGRVDALIAGDEGALYCLEFGIDTSHPWTSTVPPVSGQFLDRTLQPDNWEPNDTRDNAYPLRDATSYYYGTIVNADDDDWFAISRTYCASATIQAPRTIDLNVNFYGDRSGTIELLDSTTIAAGTRGTVSCRGTPSSFSLPTWVEITSDGFSATDPYVVDFDFNL